MTGPGAAKETAPRIGAVVIGRNEAPHLALCLQSLHGHIAAIVYVDSGSTDGSPAIAAKYADHVLELDPAQPFTAARGRQEGVELLCREQPGIEFVQFVDADCEVVESWWIEAVSALDSADAPAVVFGRCRERNVAHNVYARLLDMEFGFSTAADNVAGGGIAMFRLAAYQAVGGFDPRIRAGEEPELCRRLVERGYITRRIPVAMAIHDGRMDRFGQWWTRSVRFGAACCYHLRARSEGSRNYIRPVASAVVWAILLPVCIVGAVCSAGLIGLTPALLYLVQWVRVTARQRRYVPWRWAAEYAAWNQLGKFACVVGVWKDIQHRLSEAVIGGKASNSRSAV